MSRSVVVIGGGLAGISASLALSQAGYQVMLLEARHRLGGRLGSFDDSSGQAVDYCQHVGMACCTNLVKLLEITELSSLWHKEEELHFYSASGKHTPVVRNWLPAPFHLSGFLLRWPDLSLIERATIGYGLWKLMRSKLDSENRSETAISWLSRHAQTPSAINKFWLTILVSALGDKIERVSIEAARKVLIDGFAVHRDAYHLLIPQTSLSEMFSDRMLPLLRNRGVDVRLGLSATKLIIEERGCTGFELLNGDTIHCDTTLLAVPWYQIRKLYPDDTLDHPEFREPIDKIGMIESAPITGVHTWWDKPWLDHPHAILVDRLCQWVFANPTSNEPSDNSHYYQIVISGSRELPRGDQAYVMEAVERDLRGVFPKMAQSKLLRSRIVTDPQSVFSVTPQTRRLRPRVDAFSKQNIWLSGDWTDTGWPATMEGAIRSGFLAAESIANRSGAQFKFVAPDLPRRWLTRCLIREHC
jgi:squalene-associated FAD-dependent desaturase